MYPNFALLFLLNTNQEVLLLRRINTPFCNGCYSLPGGEVKKGETARQALVREARDSLNLRIEPDNLTLVHCMYRKCNDPEFIALIFQAQDFQVTDIVNCEPERHDLLGWYSLNSLPEPM